MTRHFSSSSFIIGVMLGLILAGAWFLGKDSTIVPISPSALTTNKSEELISNNEVVSVASQPAGFEVVVESVKVPLVGVWIAVRETNSTDLGNVLGAARVSGTHSSVSIPLLRATEPGRTYAVELYRDDNDGLFDIGFNSVYIDFDTGSPVVVRFRTTE